MEKQGEKCRRHEGAVCLACKQPDGPFPELHPNCEHPYCAPCVRRAILKRCEKCGMEWKSTLCAFNASDGNILVVRRISTGHLLAKEVFVYDCNYTLSTRPPTRIALVEHKYPEFRAWLVANGMRTEKTAQQRVARYLDRFGPNAHTEEAGAGALVVLGSVDESSGERHAVYVTDAGAEHVRICDDKITAYKSDRTSRRGLLAVIRAIENLEAQ